MKRKLTVVLALTLLLSGCGQKEAEVPEDAGASELWPEAVSIQLHENGEIDVDAPTEEQAAGVTTAHDIIYYEDGKDFTYGKGTEADAHSAEEAAAHTVVHIAQPGTYVLQGTLSKGQIAVDLGKEAKDDPDAVVTLVLNGVDITCEVAPAVIFYNVYECGSDEEETAVKDVDTSAAGANVIIADNTENMVNGSYVARIYKPESVELNEDGTEVADAKKLHKYDGAFYSKMSMNVDGGEQGTGTLAITADNEGLDTELHLTINGGNISIRSGNDGINTNEDGVSVTTINGGTLNVLVTGETGEGDGIDSNGWLVINGGSVTSWACGSSMDSGLDADNGIHINGGTVIASGNMYDRVDDSAQNYAVFSFSQRQTGGTTFTLKNADGETVMEMKPENDFQYLVVSAPDLTEGDYTLWQGTTQYAGSAGGGFGGPGMGGMMPPDGMELPEGFDPKNFDPANGEMPEPPAGFDGQMPEMPEDFANGQHPDGHPGADGQEPPERPQGGQPGQDGGRRNETDTERSETFSIVSGGSQFSNTAPAK